MLEFHWREKLELCSWSFKECRLLLLVFFSPFFLYGSFPEFGAGFWPPNFRVLRFFVLVFLFSGAVGCTLSWHTLRQSLRSLGKSFAGLPTFCCDRKVPHVPPKSSCSPSGDIPNSRKCHLNMWMPLQTYRTAVELALVCMVLPFWLFY